MVTEEQLNWLSHQVYLVDIKKIEDIQYKIESDKSYFYNTEDKQLGQYKVLKTEDNTANGMQAVAVAPEVVKSFNYLIVYYKEVFMISKKTMLAIGLGIIIIIGGLIMVKNPFTGEEKVKYKDEQDRVANYLIEHYKDIEKVEFTKVEKSKKTGYWNMDITVNSIYYISISTTDFSDGDIEVTDHIAKSDGNELSFRNKDSDSIASEVKVIYIDEEK